MKFKLFLVLFLCNQLIIKSQTYISTEDSLKVLTILEQSNNEYDELKPFIEKYPLNAFVITAASSVFVRDKNLYKIRPHINNFLSKYKKSPQTDLVNLSNSQILYTDTCKEENYCFFSLISIDTCKEENHCTFSYYLENNCDSLDLVLQSCSFDIFIDNTFDEILDSNIEKSNTEVASKENNTFIETLKALSLFGIDSLKFENHIKKSIRLDKEDKQNPFAAIIYECIGEFKNDTSQSIGFILKNYSHSPVAKYYFARFLYFHSYYDSSIDVYEKLIYNNNKQLLANSCGDAYLSGMYFDNAEIFYNKSNLISENYDANMGLGYINQKKGELKKASKYYKAAISLVKNGEHQYKAAIPYLYLSEIAIEKNDFSTAKMWCRKSIEFDNNYENNLLWGKLCILDGDWLNAYPHLDDMNRHYGDTREVRVLQIACDALQNRNDSALQMIRSFKATYPADVEWLRTELSRWNVRI